HVHLLGRGGEALRSPPVSHVLRPGESLPDEFPRGVKATGDYDLPVGREGSLRRIFFRCSLSVAYSHPKLSSCQSKAICPLAFRPLATCASRCQVDQSYLPRSDDIAQPNRPRPAGAWHRGGMGATGHVALA